jgi:hypothetical protein
VTIIRLTDLGKQRTVGEFRDKLPQLAQRLDEMAAEDGKTLRPDDALMPHVVFATRQLADLLAASVPPGPVTIDAADIEVMTPPFIDQLWLRRPEVEFINANADVAASIEIAAERRDRPR